MPKRKSSIPISPPSGSAAGGADQHAAQVHPRQEKTEAAPENPASRKDGEIFLGIVAAAGTDVELVITALTDALNGAGYESDPIRLSDLLFRLLGSRENPDAFLDEQIRNRMDWGNQLRETAGRNDALALLAVAEVRRLRKEKNATEGDALRRHAFIFRSLKHPDEVRALRSVYGPGFYLIAAYSSYLDRKNLLARKIAESRNEFPHNRQYPRASALIERDAEEAGIDHGQHVQKTFHRADVFVDASDAGETRRAIQRFVDLILGHPFHTPTRKEYAMFHAQAAALRSAELGRQVGSAVANREGDVIAVGTNDVPKAGGGLYWVGDNPDRREYTLGSDSSDDHKRRLVADTLNRLRRKNWLSRSKSRQSLESLTREALAGENAVFPRGSEIGSLIEYGRAVHAEMAALMDAARRGISVAGCSMFVTTFPCHLCARHIVAAGIVKVYFIEPYAKSLAAELYPDSIAVESPDPKRSQVLFEPFVGVAPRRYIELFTMPDRKDDDGRVLPFSPQNADPRCAIDRRVYLDNERREAGFILNVLEMSGLVVARTGFTRKGKRNGNSQ